MPEIPTLARRQLLQSAATLGGLNLLGACARQAASVPPLAPVRAAPDRIIDITVCLRPFRAAGPRLDTETIGEALVVHNYGHGGSGWSLSWGSAEMAVEKAMAGSPRQVAVLGCGAIGLTSAITAQRAGAQVTIYARELLPQTRSARATGTWSPDSRIALTTAAAPDFPALWERMARTSFKTYRSYLGLPGDPVEWTDRYILSNKTRAEAEADRAAEKLSFADYSDRLNDITPDIETLPPGSTPFPTRYVRRYSSMMFNIPDYSRTLLNDFLLAGGKIEIREFHAPAELATLKEKVVINCPGYGGRALWRDASIVPVRGQLAWLVPQPEVNYGLSYRDVAMLSRRDGILVQNFAGGDMRGYNDANETPDREEALGTVAELAEVYQGRTSF
jgi:glycine/D-amino acid oxidase-like deaminating enzyme